MILKWLCLGAAVLIWPLISFGAFVRLKGAGLSCPDWPLCYGQLFPPPGFEISLEVGHRFVATLLGLLIIVVTVFVFRQPAYRRYRKLALISLVLVCVQGILGGLTVTMTLWPPVVTLHLLGGNLLFAILVYLARMTFREETLLTSGKLAASGPKNETLRSGRSGLLTRHHVGWMLAVLLFIMASGGYNSATYSGYICEAFPGCHEGSFASFGMSGAEQAWFGIQGQVLPAAPADFQGRFLPVFENEWIHMIHRLIAVVGGMILIVTAWVWLKKRGGYKLIGISIILLILLEIGIGILNSVYRIPVPISALHTAVAATLIGLLAYVFSEVSPKQKGA